MNVKPTDFADMVSRYFTRHLVNERGSSPRTIDSYRLAFVQFIGYLDKEKGLKPKMICLRDFTRQNILGYLSWLEDNIKCSVATRNQKLAALRSFAGYLGSERPERMGECQLILAIHAKKSVQKEISYMKAEGLNVLFKQPNVENTAGFRDYVMLLLMYTTGIRVSELISIQARDISMDDPKTIRIHGKGNKVRHAAIVRQLVPHLRKYMHALGLDRPENGDDFLFRNHMGMQFTRQGVNYIVSKYAGMARKENPDAVPKDCSPHKFRHSAAMAMVEADIDLIYIRDFLGHASVTTTEVYAKADATRKRQVIEASSKEIVPQEEPKWEKDKGILEWLKNLGRNDIM
jgi:site-specific recombinase XerD